MDLTGIRGIAFDVDGVLSPSITPMDEDGQPCRMANVKDGYAIQLAVFEQWLDNRGLEASQAIFVGDDIPDLHVMAAAGVSVAPADAAWQVKEAASYISQCDGGHGVARDIIERVLAAQGMWMDDEHAFGW